ncbi:TIGR00266 family protein [Peptoniphilaceae bacterium SGI.131]
MQYEVRGGDLPVVVCRLAQGESVVSEAGAMSWYTDGIAVETKGRGGLGKMFGRAFSGEKMFQNIYTARSGPGEIAFASSFPGSILAYEVSPANELIVQKRAFLASEESVETEVSFQRKIGVGFFGGEGFIMQRLYGKGLAFLEIDGSLQLYELEAGQKLIIDTGYLVAMSPTCSIDIQSTGNMKTMFFGGEGFFNTVVTGPGKVYLQTMPISKLFGLFPSTGD